ncbi:MAG TPA: hypothetical protein VL262_02555 [Vicinamibacterales bacterium]|jgi:hypothetical protein|nr:hypothetical protein [Vicinamibacterales bacterium]
MNPYARIGFMVGTPEATSLGVRLTLWHDAMVAHERRLRVARGERCGDECPHAEAQMLWPEAVEVFGPHAEALTFLRTRARTPRLLVRT